MASVADFVFSALILLAPAMIVAAGGLVACCFRKSKNVKRGIALVSAVSLVGVSLAAAKAGFPLSTWLAAALAGAAILLQHAATSPLVAWLARHLASAVSLQSGPFRLS